MSLLPNTPLGRRPRDELSPHFRDGELVELGVMMAVLCGMAKMIFALDLVEKSPTCPL